MGQSVKQLKWASCEKNKETLVVGGGGEFRRSKWLGRWQVRDPCTCVSFSTRKSGCEMIKEVERNKDTSKRPHWQPGAGTSLACI